MSMRESQLETYFLGKVRKSLGGMCIKMMPTQIGVPDRLVLLPAGRIVLVELKADRGRLSVMQEHFASRAGALGTHVYVVRGEAGVDAWVREVAALCDPKPRKRGPKRRTLEETIEEEIRQAAEAARLQEEPA